MGLFDGLFGNDEGDGPQWGWAAKGWEKWDHWAGNPSADEDEDGDDKFDSF